MGRCKSGFQQGFGVAMVTTTKRVSELTLNQAWETEEVKEEECWVSPDNCGPGQSTMNSPEALRIPSPLWTSLNFSQLF